MILRDITTEELPAFIASELYRNSKKIPITPERADSLCNNPRTQPDDVVLVVAYTDDGQLAGFAGTLPDTGQSDSGPYRFAWNSGWWVDPVLGREIALKLLFRSVRAWKGYFMISDLTPHTRKIIALTNGFDFPVATQGIRLQILSDVAGKIARRYGTFFPVHTLLTAVDTLANIFLQFRLSLWRRNQKTKGLSVQYVDNIDGSGLRFIEKHNENELCRRAGPELKWIMSHPWIVSAVSGTVNHEYPFSRVCRHFEYKIATVCFGDEIIALFFLSNREGLFRLPYLYFNHEWFDLAVEALCSIIISEKATGFHTFRDDLKQQLKKIHFPCLYKSPATQELAVSKTLAGRNPGQYGLQDGDGDVVFT
jgi:hypothetical protein